MATAREILTSADQGGPPFYRQLFGTPRRIALVETLVVATLIGVAIMTWAVLTRETGGRPLSPLVTAALLVANLLPAAAIIVLSGRRAAVRRAARSSLGGQGRLHVRLVATFSLIATIPVLLVVIFASLQFQNGVQFWFSDPARGMLENAGSLARGYYEEKLRDVGDETVTMAGDLRSWLATGRIDDPAFAQLYFLQVFNRKLSESAVVEIGSDGVQRTAAIISPQKEDADAAIGADVLRRLEGGEATVVTATPEKIEAVTRLYPQRQVFLYASRDFNVPSFQLGERAQAVLRDYDALIARSRRLQFQFNAALYLVSLAIIGLAVWIALLIADRLVRPVGSLVEAAQQVAGGDFSARVPEADAKTADEIGLLSSSFNRMTERLEDQTGKLLAANAQLDSRRAFTEMVLESISAGVINLDGAGVIRLANTGAHSILMGEGGTLIGRRLAEVAPELAEAAVDDRPQRVIQTGGEPEPRTLAIKKTTSAAGTVLTFEDITRQLVDQRRAAWADVARRIAHEIKNPLTPIQLAAERIRRRFVPRVGEDSEMLDQLTQTIIRQVGDLRNIVDEFSSFARMPEPLFRPESLTDIVRHAVFLHDVAHPDIAFHFIDGDEGELVCDRRQIGQAATNILKNAVEAIEARAESDANFALADGVVEIRIGREGPNLLLRVTDNGIGLPADRTRITEPYMTTRSRGTGLGLAIVKKIVEEHLGDIGFDDAAGGGTEVVIRLPTDLAEAVPARSSAAAAPHAATPAQSANVPSASAQTETS